MIYPVILGMQYQKLMRGFHSPNALQWFVENQAAVALLLGCGVGLNLH